MPMHIQKSLKSAFLFTIALIQKLNLSVFINLVVNEKWDRNCNNYYENMNFYLYLKPWSLNIGNNDNNAMVNQINCKVANTQIDIQLQVLATTEL